MCYRYNVLPVRRGDCRKSPGSYSCACRPCREGYLERHSVWQTGQVLCRRAALIASIICPYHLPFLP